MLRTARSALSAALFSGLAAACATAPPPDGAGGSTGSSATYKVGKPYQIGDTWYYPREQPTYDEVGVASWYGPTFYGKHTASGEIYDGDGLTAAHKTLPLPVNVRVTNLENGKSVVLRVNDRGPFAQGRIIDVSKHAAEMLGFYAKGTARVRVTYLGRADVPSQAPDESDMVLAQAFRRAAPAGKVETASLKTPRHNASHPVRVASLDPPVLQHRAASSDAVTTSGEAADADSSEEETGTEGAVLTDRKVTHLYVQAGAFNSEDNAERLKERLSEAGAFISPADRNGRALYRVRSGPYDDLESANAALAKLTELGNNGARIVVDQ